jgi:hypothetical protein
MARNLGVTIYFDGDMFIGQSLYWPRNFPTDRP